MALQERFLYGWKICITNFRSYKQYCFRCVFFSPSPLIFRLIEIDLVKLDFYFSVSTFNFDKLLAASCCLLLTGGRHCDSQTLTGLVFNWTVSIFQFLERMKLSEHFREVEASSSLKFFH